MIPGALGTEPSQNRADETGSVLREALDPGAGTTSGQVQYVGPLQVELLQPPQGRRKDCVIDRQGDLEVEPQTPRVEVHRTEQAELTIHGNRLGVHQAS